MVYDSIVGYMEVREKMRPILQAFVEPIATLPYGNLFCPQKSCPPSTRARLIHFQWQKMTSFFMHQTHRARKAINKFLDGIEGQECSGFKDIHRFLNHLPVPAGTETRSMPHADARDGNFLPSMTEDEQKRFTPSELLLYKHALEYR